MNHFFRQKANGERKGKALAMKRLDICSEILEERHAQDRKWGQQDHPSRSGGTSWYGLPSEERAKLHCKNAADFGTLTFGHILVEELCESLDAHSEKQRRVELIQLAACCMANVEAIDRRKRGRK